MEMRHQQQAGDQKQVQQDRGRGRRYEAVDGIEKAACNAVSEMNRR
jgi:hypothetical protein